MPAETASPIYAAAVLVNELVEAIGNFIIRAQPAIDKEYRDIPSSRCFLLIESLATFCKDLLKRYYSHS